MVDINELKTELEKLKQRNFMLEMNDHWSAEDYKLSRAYNERIKELKEQIEALEGAGE